MKENEKFTRVYDFIKNIPIIKTVLTELTELSKTGKKISYIEYEFIDPNDSCSIVKKMSYNIEEFKDRKIFEEDDKYIEEILDSNLPDKEEVIDKYRRLKNGNYAIRLFEHKNPVKFLVSESRGKRVEADAYIWKQKWERNKETELVDYTVEVKASERFIYKGETDRVVSEKETICSLAIDDIGDKIYFGNERRIGLKRDKNTGLFEPLVIEEDDCKVIFDCIGILRVDKEGKEEYIGCFKDGKLRVRSDIKEKSKKACEITATYKEFLEHIRWTIKPYGV